MDTVKKTALLQFNDSVRMFVNDLKNIFGESDKEIIKIEIMLDLIKVNARLVIRPFQDAICSNHDFVRHIMLEDKDFFVKYNFEESLADNEYHMRLLHKFRDAVKSSITDKKTLKAIFNWFKVMLYHAYIDGGVDADTVMKAIAQGTD